MKKLMLFVFCAVLCAALTSCEKENDGKYSPKKKIQKVYKDNGVEEDRYVTGFSYEYDGKYPVKVMATEDGDPYYTRYYEY